MSKVILSGESDGLRLLILNDPDKRNTIDDEMRADLLNRLLPRPRLCEVVIQSFDGIVMLRPEERHVREHQQRVERRRMHFGRQHMLVAESDPGFLGER